MVAKRTPTDERLDACEKAMRDHVARHGHPPTEREIAEMLDVGKSRAHQLFAELRGRGRISGSGRRLRMVAETERMV